MTAPSLTLRDAIAGHVCRGQDALGLYLWLGLSQTLPSLGVVEPAGGGYARQQLPRDLVTWAPPADGKCAIDVDVLFPTPTDAWGTVTYAVLWTAQTAGSWLDYSRLSAARVVGVGSLVEFPAGSLTFTA